MLRKLTDLIHIPNEFKPWLPTIEIVDGFGSGGSNSLVSLSTFVVDQTIHLNPKNGQVTVLHRFVCKLIIFFDKTN